MTAIETIKNSIPANAPAVIFWMIDRAESDTDKYGPRAVWTGQFKDERRVIEQMKDAAEKGIGKVSRPKGTNAPYFIYKIKVVLNEDMIRVCEFTANGKCTLNIMDIENLD